MIVWLASYPRSGNNWFRVVAQRLFGISSVSIYGDDRAPESAGTLARMAEEPLPYLVKTHEQAQDRNPAVYLVRDGRDALVSYAWFISAMEKAGRIKREPRPFEEILRFLITTDADFGGWSSHVLGWLRRSAPVAVVKFEDLIKDPEDCIRSAFEKVGISAEPQAGQTLPTFGELHERSPSIFRKGEVGGWKAEMPDDLHEIFCQRHGAAMQKLGYPKA